MNKEQISKMSTQEVVASMMGLYGQKVLNRKEDALPEIRDVKRALRIYVEEVTEFIDAITSEVDENNKDDVELDIYDALGDIVVTLHGITNTLGIKIYDAVENDVLEGFFGVNVASSKLLKSTATITSAIVDYIQWYPLRDEDDLISALEELNSVVTKHSLIVLSAINEYCNATGVNFRDIFDEIMASNFSKVGEDGKLIKNEFGKVMKGENYFKPNLKPYVLKMNDGSVIQK